MREGKDQNQGKDKMFPCRVFHGEAFPSPPSPIISMHEIQLTDPLKAALFLSICLHQKGLPPSKPADLRISYSKGLA